MKQHIMLDLETLATSSDAVIVSIGAVAFDKNGVDIDNTFYRVLKRDEQVKKGRIITPNTVDWWMGQSEMARRVFSENSVPVGKALEDFREFVGGDPYMWGNGADFDCVLLGGLYDLYGIQKPWSYSKNRCFRTLKNLAVARNSHNLPEREGTYHNALDDALYQAHMAVEYLNGSLK